MRKNNLKTLPYIASSLVLLGIVFSLGFFTGKKSVSDIDKISTLINKDSTSTTSVDFNSFWKAWNVLKNKSIYSKDVSDEDLVWGAISGLASSMNDPYTVFFNPKDNKYFNEEIKGSFSGIGAELGMKDGLLTIIAPLKDTPAWRAGILSGDKILKIDNTDTSLMTVDKAISLIRGEKGTNVVLTIFREGERETRDIKITRDDINYPIVETEKKDDVFVIKFYSFSENSVSLFKNALDEFLQSKDKKLIIDLRGNPGGYLEAAVDIGSWFLDSGKVIVSEDFGNGKRGNIYRSHGPKIIGDDVKVVVLVNGGSASASEILAGALQEHKVATLIGVKTFGKGSVQELVPITSDTSLKVTIAKWLTPNGVSISNDGLNPDIDIPMTLKDLDNKIDTQMNKALEVLNK